jgi:ketosteroid isomerase-like protein
VWLILSQTDQHRVAKQSIVGPSAIGHLGDQRRFDPVNLREGKGPCLRSGNPKPLHAIAAESGKVTFFPPSGGVISRANSVTARYDVDAKSFAPGTKNRLGILYIGAASDLAFWTGLQHFEGKFRGKDAKMKLRVTEVFRLSHGEWKLIHRHVDSAGDSQKRTGLFKTGDRAPHFDIEGGRVPG